MEVNGGLLSKMATPNFDTKVHQPAGRTLVPSITSSEDRPVRLHFPASDLNNFHHRTPHLKGNICSPTTAHQTQFSDSHGHWQPSQTHLAAHHTPTSYAVDCPASNSQSLAVRSALHDPRSVQLSGGLRSRTGIETATIACDQKTYCGAIRSLSYANLPEL